MKKRIISWVLVFCMLSAVFLPTASAAQGATVTAKNATATAGGYAYVYLDAANFTDVATLDLEIYYDSSVMSVHYTSNGTLLSGASVSTNTSEAGVIKISTASVSGITATSGRLMTICFKVDSACPAGEYPVFIAVGDSYSSALAPISVSAVSGAITVSEAAIKTFNIYGSQNTSVLGEGDLYKLQVYHTTSQTFASADFQVEYDRELFELQSVTLHNGLTVEGAVYSVNTATQGLALISYASTDPISNYYLFTVELKVIADKNTTTTVSIKASDVYTDALTAYAPGTATKSLTLQAKAQEADHPDVYLDLKPLRVGQETTAALTLEQGAGVAAADFTVSYDPAVFSCTAVNAASLALEKGGLVVINPNLSEGTVKFSYVNESGYSESDLPLVELTLVPLTSPSEHFVISSAATGVVDKNYNDIALEYVKNSACIYEAVTTPATCVATGNVIYQCACGLTDGTTTVLPIDPTAHKWESDFTVDIPETCGKEGSKSIHCEYCDTTKDVTVIPATGKHTAGELITDTAPTCSATGLGHKDCTVCGLVAEKDVIIAIDPAAHKWESDFTVDIPETCGKEGSKSIHCEYCDTTKDVTVIPATGKHTAGDLIIDTAPTALEQGIGHKDCIVCGLVAESDIAIPALGVASIDGTPYPTLKEALEAAESGEVVQLNISTYEEYVIVDAGVTLNLNEYTVEAEYVVGFVTSTVYGGSLNGGRLKVDKGRVALDLNNGGYLPVYDNQAKEYLFTTVTMRGMFTKPNYYLFSPVFKPYAHEALNKPMEESGVRIAIRLTWTKEQSYMAEQDFIYLYEEVKTIIESYGTKYKNDYERAFSASFSGTEAGDAANVLVSAVIISDTGVEIRGEASSFDS